MDTAVIPCGAGSRGIFGAGAIKALVDAKVPINYIVGTSSGAMNGAYLCSGQIDEMINLWMTIKNKSVFRKDYLSLLNKKCAAYDTSPLRKLLTSTLDYKAIQQSKIPCIVNASDLRAHKTISTTLNSLGNQDAIVSAIMGSAAFPIAFPKVNGLVDGGLSLDFPAVEALGLNGVERVIIISSSIPEYIEPKWAMDELGNVLSFMVYCQLNQVLAALEDVRKLNPLLEIILIQPEKPTALGALDFDGLGDLANRQRIISWGYRRAQEAIKGLVY